MEYRQIFGVLLWVVGLLAAMYVFVSGLQKQP